MKHTMLLQSGCLFSTAHIALLFFLVLACGERLRNLIYSLAFHFNWHNFASLHIKFNHRNTITLGNLANKHFYSAIYRDFKREIQIKFYQTLKHQHIVSDFYLTEISAWMIPPPQGQVMLQLGNVRNKIIWYHHRSALKMAKHWINEQCMQMKRKEYMIRKSKSK